MVEFTYDDGRTRIQEDGFTLLIHTDGRMFVQHPCPDSNGGSGFDPMKAALLYQEILGGECLDCGKVSLPDDLKGIWYLYNFDRIQRGDK